MIGTRSEPTLFGGFLSLAALVVALAALPGCDVFAPRACTLIGCTSTIDLLLPEAHSSVYEVSIESPTVSGTVECVPPDPDEEDGRWSERLFTGDLRAQGPAVATVVCDASRVSLQFFDSEPDMPKELTVTIDGEHSRSRTFDDIEYAVSQPNGPDCPPVCSQVELSL